MVMPSTGKTHLIWVFDTLVLSLLYDKVLHSLKYCEEIYLCIAIFTYILCTHTMYLMYP